MVDFFFERIYWNQGIRHVAGIDEAGRGPLDGPVVAAAVILAGELWIDGVDDSKKLSAARRDYLFDMISQSALSIGVGIIDHATIDTINIYHATMKAMKEAVRALAIQPGHLLVDGPRYHDASIPFTPVINGDAQCISIAAASIIAKVTRDRLMAEYDLTYPQYGFAKHKGYGTPDHLEALRRHGPCSIHRKSFTMPSKEGAGGYEQSEQGERTGRGRSRG